MRGGADEDVSKFDVETRTYEDTKMEYDFKALSDYDFEQLVCDLLSARQGQQVESFRFANPQRILWAGTN